MENTMMLSQSCQDTLRKLDLFVDNEIRTAETAEILRHLESCPSCGEELELRRRLRNRLRAAASSDPRPYLQTKVLASVRSEAAKQQHRGHGWFRQLVAAGATVCLTILAGSVAYNLGYLRFSAESQERYVRAISAKVSSVMAVGLGDHVHCTVFGNHPKKDVRIEEVANELPPDYQGLLKEVADDIPPGYNVFTAHTCRYHKRPFYHIAMRKGDHLVSLVITRRQPGEDFNAADVVASLNTSGIPVHSAGVQRYSISAFETKGHLAYFVSDLAAGDNGNLMLSLGPMVSSYLKHLES